MSRQERTARRTRKAAAQAEAIIDSAVKTLERKGSPAPMSSPQDWQQPEDCDDETWEIAVQVRRLREEEGLAWWRIGHALSLPGSADNLEEGKVGARQARRAYRKAFGEIPKTHTWGQQSERQSRRADTNPDRAALKATPKGERVEAVRSGRSVIDPEMDDDAVLAMVKGRTITWSINLGNIDGMGDRFVDESSTVHRVMARVETQPNGVRVLHFKEVHDNVPIEFKGRAAGTRTVRLSSIHTIR